VNRLIWTALLCTTAWASPAAGSAEAPSRWTTRLGYAHASFDTKSELTLAGAPAPGATVTVDDQGIFMGDVGFDVTENWTARVAIGAPVALPVLAGGTLQGLSPPLTGTLGEIEIAPVVVSLLYAPRRFGGFEPYLGAGAAYTYILDTKPGDVASLEASSGWGAVLQAGCNFAITPRLWAYADARKIYFETTASGVVPALGGLPVEAAVTLDPLIFNAGVGYRF
jgi:outer membrane protein